VLITNRGAVVTEHTGSIEGNISVAVPQFSLLANGLRGVLAQLSIVVVAQEKE